ncbi:MAG: tRNA (N6-threonylcarbamoyladenosine(37)-N6)-methyltransferase TrmO [Eubacterium sp.]|nr:tRNA (N6-threonylcarbamoyladenosine(37)-N6)-methyltransferase TrmO [Eubacterium sp.]
MPEEFTFKTIAHVHSLFSDKFGIPRQSGLAELPAKIVFEPEYRVKEAVRGLEDYSHIWILWQFSKAVREDWSPTVRPPRLGGNTRVGVFSTRSPFRPNPIGLSSVKLDRIDLETPDGPVLYISGADILDGTPVYDIKPYLAYTDAHPDAVGGFSQKKTGTLEVHIPDDIISVVPENLREGLVQLLSQDPRPAYQNDPERVYKMDIAGFNISFSVQDNSLVVSKINETDRN